MSQLIDTLASYVPWLVTRRFAEDPRPLEAPLFERFPAAVLFADISGVTRLSKELAAHSTAAAEDLTYVLNNYFGSLIDLISAHGGDIVKFAGDGLYAIWPTIAHNEPLATVTLRAMQCAWEVRQRLSGYQVPNVEQRLFMRIGVGAGEVLTATVGGVLKRWEFLLAGQPIGQINRASSIAHPGEVVLSPEAWELVQQHCIGATATDGHVRLEQVNPEIPRRLLPTPALAETATDGLRGFVAGAILARLDAGQVDWLAENRRVTVLFLNIISLSQSTLGIVERLQDVMQAMQVTLYHYEGSVRQFIMDDKGTVFIAAFGLPPRTHEDDPVRGVQAAIALKAKLKELGLDSSIGVATGMSFCGPVGNRLRREYALVGDIVYLSARLMVAAQNSILCDESTYQATSARLRYSQLHPVQVKNRAEPVKVYSPHGKAQLEDSLRPIVGRTIERGLLAQQLEALARRESRIVVVEGDTGIGKSRLVAELRQLAEAQHFQVLVGEADAVDHATPYHAWRAIFSMMFHMESFTQTR
jgi:class 3 adenylate cyclase